MNIHGMFCIELFLLIVTLNLLLLSYLYKINCSNQSTIISRLNFIPQGYFFLWNIP